LITSDFKHCFSGFHVSNIAVAFASKGIAAQVYELSGLLPNAGFYMSLPPERYIHCNGNENTSLCSGLAGVKIAFSLQAKQGFKRQVSGPRIDLIHMPPVNPERTFRESLDNVKAYCQSPTAALVLKRGDSSNDGDLEKILDKHIPWTKYFLNLTRKAQDHSSKKRRSIELGTVMNWEIALKDRIPTVTRVPSSRLSKIYESICESLLCRMDRFRRKSSATSAFSRSSRIRSR
jgi:hypothetical protein